MSLIKMMLVMVSVAAISKTFGLLRFLLRLSFLGKLRILTHLMDLWVCKLLMLICILTKNVITSCSVTMMLFLHLEVKPLMTLTTVLYLSCALISGHLAMILDLTEDDFDFLTSNKVWIATDRSRARRCVEACVYGTLDFVGYPRFPAPVEFIAAVIAYYVHPVNIQTACLIMEGAEFTENIINGVERPVKAAELFAFTLRVRAGNTDVLTDAEENVRQKLRAEGVM